MITHIRIRPLLLALLALVHLAVALGVVMMATTLSPRLGRPAAAIALLVVLLSIAAAARDRVTLTDRSIAVRNLLRKVTIPHGDIVRSVVMFDPEAHGPVGLYVQRASAPGVTIYMPYFSTHDRRIILNFAPLRVELPRD